MSYDLDWMLGITIDRYEKNDEELYFYVDWPDNPYCISFDHKQDCCESVYIEDICGNLDDLIGSPILSAEEVINIDEEEYESTTWTFYKFSTIKGSVTIRWLGTSNGYYSERVDININGDDPERFMDKLKEKSILSLAGVSDE